MIFVQAWAAYEPTVADGTYWGAQVAVFQGNHERFSRRYRMEGVWLGWVSHPIIIGIRYPIVIYTIKWWWDNFRGWSWHWSILNHGRTKTTQNYGWNPGWMGWSLEDTHWNWMWKASPVFFFFFGRISWGYKWCYYAITLWMRGQTKPNQTLGETYGKSIDHCGKFWHTCTTPFLLEVCERVVKLGP